MPTGLGGEELWLSPTVANNVNPFDDQSGNGNNGTAQGGMGTVADTSEGGSYAYDFDGTDDYISGLGQSEWDFVNKTGVFSVSAWCKADSAHAGSTLQVIGGDTATTKTGFAIWEAGNTSFAHGYRFDMAKGTSGTYQSQAETNDTSVFTDWKCVTATGDGTTLRLYIDGVLADTDTIASTTNSQSAALLLGSYKGTSLFYGGLIDDVRIYDRALTQAEITHLASSRGVLGPPSGDNYNPFRNAKYINKTYQIPRFG